jgi:Flp pilus assembly protein TadG
MSAMAHKCVEADDARRRPRRGATLVMVAMLMTVLVMFVGLAVDFGRMYLFRAQLASLGDATALTSISDLRLSRQAESQLIESARDVLIANRVGDGTRRSLRIEAGQWNFAQNTFAPSTWAGATSVRVTATVTADWTLARIFGSSTKTMNTTTVASFAAVRSSACMRPFLMPYGALLARLGRSSQDMSYRLTPADLATLRSMTTIMPYTLGNVTSMSTTGFVPAAYRTPVNSEANLANALLPGCGGSTTLAVGDSAYAYTGSVTGNAVLQALGALCPGSGDVWNRSCTPAPTMHVPIFDAAMTVSGTMRYRIRYIGAFRLTRLSRESVGDRIYGNFTAVNASGAGDVLQEVGPVFRAALAR